jgi:hypothetical protein
MTFARAFDYAAQILIPTLTLSSVLAISLKHPALGLLLNLLAQPFWLYSTYIAWKRQGQIGMFINTIAYACITAFGVINYYLLS